MTILLNWAMASSVGVQAMDDEHAILVDAMNELRVALVQGAPPEQTNGLMNKLIKITRMHFWNEEHLMEQYGCPYLVEHRAEHLHLLAQIGESASWMQFGKAVHTSEFLSFLHHWFIDHVEGMDQKYGAWLNQYGVH